MDFKNISNLQFFCQSWDLLHKQMPTLQSGSDQCNECAKELMLYLEKYPKWKKESDINQICCRHLTLECKTTEDPI